MTIYVDQFPWTSGRWANGGHMLTTDIDELHEMADMVGLQRRWFQNKRIPHYDLTKTKREKAITLGAVEIEFGDLPDDVLRRCDNGSYEPKSARKSRLS